MTLVAGQTHFARVQFANAAGPVNYANTAAFTGAGGALSYRVAGTAVGSPTWTLTGLGNGWHELALTLVAGDGSWIFSALPAGVFASPIGENLRVQTSDEDAIAALQVQSNGIQITQASTQITLTWVDGDDLKETIGILDAAIAKVGGTTLAALTDIYVGIKAPSATSGAASTKSWKKTVGGFITIASDTAGNRSINLADAFPAALALSTDSTQSGTWLMDVVVVQGTKKYTAVRAQITVVWQADIQ